MTALTKAVCSKHSCAGCAMRKTTEWADLSPSEIELLGRRKIEKQFLPGETLYQQGEESSGVHCIHSGLIGLRRLDADGNSILVRMAHPGETVGYRSFLKNTEHSHTAEILAPSIVCMIEKSAVSKLLHNNPDLGLRFLSHSLKDLNEAEEKLLQHRTWPAKARLLHTLVIFNHKYGKQTAAGGWQLDLPISRRELAACVGTTPEAMSRLVRQVQDEGLVTISGKHVEIPCVDHVLNTLPTFD